MSDLSGQHPLKWPVGWKRTPPHKRRTFPGGSRGTFGTTMMRLGRELRLSGAEGCVVSTDLELRLDGLPRLSAKSPVDPGIALYFEFRGKSHALACDTWNSIPDNMRALCMHIGALRGMDRWGVGSIEQAFTGYLALPAAGESTAEHWTAVFRLEFGTRATLEEVRQVYAEMVKMAHPDHGGSTTRLERVQRAWKDAQRDFAAAVSA